jgi:hypothetical protein
MTSLGGGHVIVPPTDNYDVLFVGSYSQYDTALRHAHRAPMINYVWDFYEWCLSYPQYSYEKYRTLLEQSFEIWTPSQCTSDRLKEFWGLDSVVVKCAVPYRDLVTRDDRFVLQPLRNLPDKWQGWTERACEELGIPCVSPDHSLPQAEYDDLMASCSFIVSGYYEASTGGLSAMEGYYNGKPVIGSGSPYCGLRDTLGTVSATFPHTRDVG